MRAGEIRPLPLPKRLRTQAATPRARLWSGLSARERELAGALVSAGTAGRKLLFHQSHRHALLLREAFLTGFSAARQEWTRRALGDTAYRDLLVYAAKFLDQGGPYASSNRKYAVESLTPESFSAWLAALLPQASPSALGEMVRLVVDPTFETAQFPELADGADLSRTGGNLYERGIEGPDVKRALSRGLLPTLNSRVVRRGTELATELQTTSTPGVVGRVLTEVAGHLERARELATTEWQRKQIEHTLTYFRHGDVEEFRQANIAWVRDRSSSRVDFMIGWVEVYEDWLARIGSWESYVQFVDPEISRKAQRLAAHAQEFEDAMPYGAYKKRFPADYSPPALMVYYFQEIASYRSGGYNLPNFDDIRRDVGAKNVIRLPMPGEEDDPEAKAIWEEMLREFLPADRVKPVLERRTAVWEGVVLLHEIIGHGSGTYDTSKYAAGEDPISGLGSLGSALEEQRSDLAALVFLGSPIAVAAGLHLNAEEARRARDLAYDYYLADFLRRTSGQRTFTEAHQRGHWLFVNRLLRKGVIEWVGKSGGAPTLDDQVLRVRDYDRFEAVSRELLGELQGIKATRDEADLRRLFDEEAPLSAIDEPWARAIIRRGQELRINAGYVEQPWRISGDGTLEALGEPTLESSSGHWASFY